METTCVGICVHISCWCQTNIILLPVLHRLRDHIINITLPIVACVFKKNKLLKNTSFPHQ